MVPPAPPALGLAPRGAEGTRHNPRTSTATPVGRQAVRLSLQPGRAARARSPGVERGLALAAAAGAVAASCRTTGRRPRPTGSRCAPHQGARLPRRAVELVLQVPDVEDVEVAGKALLGALPADMAGALEGLTAQLAGLTGGLPALPHGLPDAPAASAITAALPADIVAVLADPAFVAAAQPASAGALIVWLLALRRGRQRWAEELPLRYDGLWIEAYWSRRPLQLFKRFVEVAIKVGAFSVTVELDKAFGKEEENMPRRAVELRELITDLGPTFVKISQVWASRPDVLPEPYQKECQKLLEQVRPFGREEAMETLRRNIPGNGEIERLFDDMAAFEKPVAAASVGQVYKASMKGREVAVKVQRPDVREQVTLDLYVVRRLAGIGSYLPIERYAQQFQSLLELLDRAAPPFIEELDYDNEATNQRKFAESVANCELVRNTVQVPEVVLSKREVLVQEWLPGKKLTEPGAAQDQAERVVKVLLNSYMVQFLETGLLHGDPHPGNFVLTPSGKIGILDYGLMTTISPEKRVAFIEYIMHVQAKMYDECLQDLVNLEFLPQGIANDKEAREVIVPGLVDTLAILYEGSGDMREQQKKFEKQRDELQATGKLEVLRAKLQDISKKHGSFKLPGYMTLIIRAFATLEGVGLKTDGQFNMIKECFPYVARRLLTDDSLRIRDSLKAYLYKGGKRISVARIDELASSFGNFTNLMKGSRRDAVEAGAPIAMELEDVRVARDASAAEVGADRVKLDAASQDIATVLFAAEGNFLQELLIDEAVSAIDALSRASLVQLLRLLGPLATPLKQRLNFVLGSSDFSRTETVILTREDKESLLLLRRIVRLVQGARQPDQGEDSDDGVRNMDAAAAFRELQRLGPLASGLLPTVAPGAAAFARRLLLQLGSRLLLRLAGDLERGVGGPGRMARSALAVAQ